MTLETMHGELSEMMYLGNLLALYPVDETLVMAETMTTVDLGAG